MAVNLELVKQITDSVYTESPKEYKVMVETRLGELLYSGEISKEEMQEVEQYLDDNMYGALAAKIRVDENLDSANFLILPNNVKDLIIKTGLSHSDIEEIVAPYMDDYTINAVKLNKAEKKDAKAGELTRSEEENIKKAINAKIEANGTGQTLSKIEVKKLLKGLGFNIDTAKGLKAYEVALHFLTLGIYTIARSKKKEEIAYPTTENRDYIQNGSVTNKTEAKMQDLEKTKLTLNDEVEKVPWEMAMPAMPD